MKVTKIKLVIIASFFVLFMIWIYQLSEAKLDITKYDSNKVMEHVAFLTSEQLEGRMTGSLGNQKAMDYIESYFRNLGIEAPDGAENYQQVFSSLVPQFDTKPELFILDSRGNVEQELIMFRDYSPVFSPHGGPVDFSAEFVVLGSDVYRVEASAIEGKIVVVDASRLSSDMISHVLEMGGKGLLCSADTNAFSSLNVYETVKYMDVSGMGGDSIFLGYISRDTYALLEKTESNRMQVKIAATFPIVDTANIIGKIEGRNKNGNTLLLSANLDGLGVGVEGSYFPGAMNSATGVGILLETARVMKLSEALPYETILLVLWNGSNQADRGVKYYIDHPIESLDQTTVIHLDQIGNPSTEGLLLAPDPLNGGLIADLMLKHGTDYGLVASKRSSRSAISYLFLNEKVPSVVLCDSMSLQNNYLDSLEAIDKKNVEEASKILLSYMKRVVYRDAKIDYLSFAQKAGIVLIGFLGALILTVGVIYQSNSATKFGRFDLEALYFSTPYLLLRKLFTSVFPYILVVFMLAALVNIDPNADMITSKGRTMTNISVYLIVKNSILYLQELFTLDLFNAKTLKELFRVLADSSRLSIVLVSMALMISAVLGILSGMIEAYRSKKTSLSSLTSLVFFSIPDVLIVLVLSLAYTKFLIWFPKLNGMLPMKEFILPLVTLSVVPTVYITRITFVTIQEEMVKDYIKNEKAKGFSRKKIIFVELLPAILFKIVDTMPAIMTMLLSNMIIVEYLFNYKGILYFLVYLYNRQDVFRFVPLALVLGLIYVLYTGGFKFISKMINPLKRKGEVE